MLRCVSKANAILSGKRDVVPPSAPKPRATNRLNPLNPEPEQEGRDAETLTNRPLYRILLRADFVSCESVR
jgi:hypothetical protein